MLNRIYKSAFFNPIYYFARKCFSLAAYVIPYRYKQAKNPTLTLETIRRYNKNRTLGPKKIICNAPFKHMYFKQNGDVIACCATSVEAYGNIRRTSVRDIWEGEKANELRDRIQNYNLSGGCSGCQYSLESGNYNAFIGRIYDTLLPSVSEKYPTEITFEISNTCNLECIMCTGEFSNLIRKNIEKLPDIPNYYDERFFEQIKEFLPHLKRVRFMGGEPFLIKQYAPIMEFLVKENPDCKIHIQTNGTILNSAVKKIVESKNVEISISIDSLIKENYNAIRVNGNFERTMQNISYFSQRAKKYNQLININFCVIQNNWKEVPEIVHFCEKNNFTLNLIPVENPRHLALRSLHSEELNKIAEFSKKHSTAIKHPILKEIYTGYINYLLFLIESAQETADVKSSLMDLSYNAINELAQTRFCKLHSYIEFEKTINIYNTSLQLLDNLEELQKKHILANLIIDIEHVNSITDKIKENSEEELISKTNVLFEQMKLEIFKSIN